MAATYNAKYVLTAAAGKYSLLDLRLKAGLLSLDGQAATVVGNAEVDFVYASLGMSVDFSNSGAGADRLCLDGAVGDYLAHVNQIGGISVLTLTRGTNTYKLSATDTGDAVVFTNGSATVAQILASIGGTSTSAVSANTAKALSLSLSGFDTSSTSLTAPASTDLAATNRVSLQSSGTVTATANQAKLIVSGSAGVDTVYVKAGATADLTGLGGSMDKIYFTGKWSEYTKTVKGTTLTFSRSIDGVNESAVVAAGAGVLNDRLIFADGNIASGLAIGKLKTNTALGLADAGGVMGNLAEKTAPDLTVASTSVSPQLTGLSLAGQSHVAVDSNIVLTFNKAVQAGSGNIVISDGTDTRTISITDTSQVTISGNTVTINPTADLWLSTQSSSGASAANTVVTRSYSVKMAAGAVQDTEGHAFAGINDTTTLAFSTESSHLVTLKKNGSDAQRIDMVFVGDGYQAADAGGGKFIDNATTCLNYLFSSGALTQPFGRYASTFNIYALEVASVDSGIDFNTPTAVTVNTAFDGAQNSVTERLLYVNDAKANRVVTAALTGTDITPDMKIAVLNTTYYGGAGGNWASYSLVSGAQAIAAHEIGHSFAHLADEYTVGGPTTYAGKTEPVGANLTIDKTGAKWAPWLGQYQDGIGMIGTYEGGGYSVNGIYRPSVNSKMNDQSQPFDPISREQFVLAYYTQVHPLDAYSDADAGSASLSVSPIDPTLIDLKWSIDGVASAVTAPWLDLTTLAAGQHTVTVAASDNSGWVCQAYMDQVTQTQSWTVTVQAAQSLGVAGGAYTVAANGNHWVKGGVGNDQIQGSAGNDRLEGGAGDDTLYGNAGDDVLMGGTGNNVLDGGDGVNTVSYQDFTDAVTVSLALAGAQQTSTNSRDTLVHINNLIGGAGNDALTGNDGPNYLAGMAGNDTLTAGQGNNVLDGGDGDDTITAGNGNNRVLGGAGNDTITVGKGDNLIDGGAGNDTITAGNGNNIIHGGSGNDTISVGNGNNTLYGEDGDDRITGGSGNDLVLGGTGTNVLDGGGGTNTVSYADATVNLQVSLAVLTAQNTGYSTDTLAHFQNLIGGSGNDTLTGDANANTLQGGAGDDTLIGGAGDDIYVGGAGNNTASFVGSSMGVTATLLPANAVVDQSTGKAIGSATGEGNDTLWQINNLTGSNWNDKLTGDGFDNVLRGGLGGDVLTGGGGADTFVMDTAIGLTRTSSWIVAKADMADASSTSQFYLSVDNLNPSYDITLTGVSNTSKGPYDVTGAAYMPKVTLSGTSSDGTLASLVAALQADTDYATVSSNYTITEGTGTHSGQIVISFLKTSSVLFQASLTATGKDVDVLTDFQSGTDHIQLAASVFTGIGTNGALNSALFCQSLAAETASSRILYDAATGKLSYDADGLGSASSAVLFAQLLNKPATLSASDFVVL